MVNGYCSGAYADGHDAAKSGEGAAFSSKSPESKAGLKTRLTLLTCLAAGAIAGTALFAGTRIYYGESEVAERRIIDGAGRLERLLEDGFTRTEALMRETALFLAFSPSATEGDLQGVFNFLTGRYAPAFVSAAPTGNKPGTFSPRSPLFGSNLFPWEYIAWYDSRTGSITATPGTDRALVTPVSLGDLVMSDDGNSNHLRIGKALYGATGNHWTLPAALTVYDAKGEKLGALVVGLALDGIAMAMENALSGGDVDFALADEDLFFIAQSPERAPEQLSHELVTFLSREIFGADKPEGLMKLTWTVPDRPPYAYKRLSSLPLYVVAGYSREALDLSLWQKLWTLGAAAAVALASLAGLASLLRRAVLKPVERLAAAYARAKRGEEVHPLKNSAPPEVEALAEMARTLSRKKREEEFLRAEIVRSRELTLSALRRVTHDLKTPLTQILGFSEIALKEYAGPEAEKQKEYIRMIREAALSQHLQINSFTEQIKTPEEAAKESLRKEQVDPERAARDIVKAVHSRAADKGVKVVVEADENLPVLYADKREFGCVLLCLLSNAVKYNRAGGEAKLCLRASHDRRFLRLSCEDTGAGIPEEGMRKLFTPFVRSLSAAGSEHHPDGAGLGLAYVKRSVYRHNGYIMADSEPGKGTCIACYFPAAEEPERGGADSEQTAAAFPDDEEPSYDFGFGNAVGASVAGEGVESVSGVEEAAAEDERLTQSNHRKSQNEERASQENNASARSTSENHTQEKDAEAA